MRRIPDESGLVDLEWRPAGQLVEVHEECRGVVVWKPTLLSGGPRESPASLTTAETVHRLTHTVLDHLSAAQYAGDELLAGSHGCNRIVGHGQMGRIEIETRSSALAVAGHASSCHCISATRCAGPG